MGTDRFADGNNQLRLFNKEAPDVTIIKGVRIISSHAAQRVLDELDLEEGGVVTDLTNAVWVFGPQSDFTLNLAPTDNRARESNQLKGAYSLRDGIIEFHAEQRPAQGAVISIDGTIAQEQDSFHLDGVYSVCPPISPPVIARIRQRLQEAPEPVGGEPPASIDAIDEAQPAVFSLPEWEALPGNEWIQGLLESYRQDEGSNDIPVPSFFDIVLEGKTEASPFGPLAGTLILMPALPPDHKFISLTLSTEGPCSNGWLSWITDTPSLTPHKDRPSRFEVSIVGNTIEVKLLPSPYAELTTWYTIPKNASIAGALTPVNIRSATLWLEINEKKFLTGRLQGAGIYDWDNEFELSSSYEATISGRVRASAEVGLTRAEVANRSFEGIWLCDASQFGKVELATHTDRVWGQYDSGGGGTIEGVVAGNLAEFTWSDSTGDGGRAFVRLVAGGRLLAGMYAHGTGKNHLHSIVAARQSDSTLMDKAYNSSDRKELRRLGIDLVLEGKLDMASHILEKALQLYAEVRDSERDVYMSREGDLLDEGSILNYLNICYYNLGDYARLLDTLNREVDIQRLLSPFEYFKSLFSQRAADLLKVIAQGRSTIGEIRLSVLATRTEADADAFKGELSRKIERLADILLSAWSQLGSTFNLVADSKYRVETSLINPRDELKALASALRDQRRAFLDRLLMTPEWLRETFPDEAELVDDAAVFFRAFYPEQVRDASSINIEELRTVEKNIHDRLRSSARLTPPEKALFAEYLQLVFISSLPRQLGLESDFIASMDVDSAWESQDQLNRSSALQLATTLENWRARLLTDLDKIAALDQAQAFFQKLIKLLVSIGDMQGALLAAETGRARAFIDMMLSGLSSSPQSAPSQVYQDTVVNLISAPPPSIEMMKRASLAHDATIVYYAIAQGEDEEVYIWVVQPNGSMTLRSNKLDQFEGEKRLSIEDLINRARFNMGVATGEVFLNNDSGSSIAASVKEGGLRDARPIGQSELDASAESANIDLQLLYQLLIAPISALLPDCPKKLVIFIPQGALFQVPFACLRESTQRDLIDQHTILLAPSVQLLDLIHQRSERLKPGPEKRVLVMGNPVMPLVKTAPDQPAERLRNLPGAEREARMVAALMDTTALVGNEATRATIIQLMRESRVIHLATHALLDDLDGSGMPGAIAMTPSGSDSGLMTTKEVLGLKLEADLFVLSACNTGRGRITGDGVIGLSRSLLLAGASSVIVSLWSVDDEASAFLMNEFYRNYTGGLSKAAALRKAALRARKLYHAPAKWSAFTLIGEAT